MWMRADGKLPDEPLLHACLVAYASDMTLLDTIMAPHGLIWSEGSQASLDHAMWFHRPFRADEWLLYDQRSPTRRGWPWAGHRHHLHPRRWRWPSRWSRRDFCASSCGGLSPASRCGARPSERLARRARRVRSSWPVHSWRGR